MSRIQVVASLLLVLLPLGSLKAQKAVKVPEKILAEMAFLVGEWDYTAIENGKKFVGHYTARWAPGRQGLWMTFVSEIDAILVRILNQAVLFHSNSFSCDEF